MDQSTFDQLVADVKARTDLVAVVRRYVELRESGNHYVGRSLKNADTTPSLVVWPATQKWRDYSGGGSGSGAGERGALETAKVLHAAGRDVRIATIPRSAGVEKIDVNDVVRTQGGDGLRAVVEAARSLPRFLVERIPEDIDRRELVDALRPVVEAMRRQSPVEQSELKAAIGARFSLAKRELNQQLTVLERELRRERLRELDREAKHVRTRAAGCRRAGRAGHPACRGR